jgi:hypothetical protein
MTVTYSQGFRLNRNAIHMERLPERDPGIRCHFDEYAVKGRW